MKEYSGKDQLTGIFYNIIKPAKNQEIQNICDRFKRDLLYFAEKEEDKHTIRYLLNYCSHISEEERATHIADILINQHLGEI